MTLFGYGNTTKAFARRFGPCAIFDDNINRPFTDEFGNKLFPSSLFNPKYSTLEIPSPGIPPNHPLIVKATNLMSDYDYMAQSMPFSIWVSGTNGKTTVTQMITYLLSDRGAVSGGNIGEAVSELDEKAPIWVLESSSFTLHYTNIAKPNIYVLLPITPDHIYWHGTFEEYEISKLKPLKSLKEGEVAIVPKRYKDYPSKGLLISYESADDLAKYFNIDIEQIEFKGVFLLNATIALAVNKVLFDTVDYIKMNSFALEAHRQEELKDSRGRLWVNDSKATNANATIWALRAYKEKHIHLIIGGDDKGVDLSELFNELGELSVTLYGIGKNMATTQKLAQKHKITYYGATTLQSAVLMAHNNHNIKSVAMLSPAAASLDQFSSYLQRGELFKKAVKELS